MREEYPTLDTWKSNPDSPNTCPECGSGDVAKLYSGAQEMRRWVLDRCRNCQRTF